jgi:hypothetical protein
MTFWLARMFLGRGVCCYDGLVKRDRKKHVIDQVDRLRELEQIDLAYGDQEAKEQA